MSRTTMALTVALSVLVLAPSPSRAGGVERTIHV